MKTIITIGRQFGSGGKEIGIRVAKELGIPFYDDELLHEAAKQSGRAHVPEIAPVRSLNNALKDAAAEGFDLILVAWEEEHALPLSKAVGAYTAAHGTPEKVLIVIGPEGGISPEEKARLDEIGAQSVTLGKRILRTETAGLCALAALWTALGEM